MPNYRLSNLAEQQLEDIYLFGLIRFGLKQADSYHNTLRLMFDDIAAHPQKYMSVDEIKLGYRRCVFESHSIYFCLGDDDVVEIKAIIGAQDISRLPL